MWRLYCRDGGKEGQGVALRSTLEKIEASVAHHDLFVSPIKYRYYHEGDAFDDELDVFMHKRMGFKNECEVRLLKYDHTHYIELTTALTSGDPARATAPVTAAGKNWATLADQNGPGMWLRGGKRYRQGQLRRRQTQFRMLGRLLFWRFWLWRRDRISP